MTSLRQRTFNGMVWSAIDRFASTGISFVFNIIIARLLMPEDYGIVAMIGIFLAICQCFIDSGFSSALIRKNDRTDSDLNTVFYFNTAIAIFTYALLFVIAPYIANFYKQPLLIKVTRLVGLNLIINALSGVHNTLLSINLNFRSKAVISLTSVLFSGIIGLLMAYNGFGVMALIFQGLASSSIRSTLFCILVKWRPKLEFSIASFREMFSFGSKLLASSLIDTIYNNIYTLVIGKVFSPAKLGNYSRADGVAAFPSSGITSVLQSVSFPVLSSIQDDEAKLIASYKKFLRLSAFIIFPLMVGMAAIAEPFIKFFLTEKWSGAILMTQILCIALMWYPIHAINLNILYVKGRSDYFLKLEIIKKILGIITLCFTIPLGLIPMCIGRIFMAIICLPINSHYTKKLINYGFYEQTKDMLHILFLSALMGLIVYTTIQLIPFNWLKLIIGISVGTAIYTIGASLLKFPEWTDLINILKEKLHNK